MAVDEDFLRQLDSGLQQTGTRDVSVLVAVSGGPDSVALLRGLLQRQEAFGLTLHAAHFNHRFRGAESDGEAEWVADLARSCAVSLTVGSAEAVSASVREESARNLRYGFLRQAAEKVGANVIATGHTRDDQVETVLHHILRGTGLTGLQGIPRQRELTDRLRLVRPILDVSHAEVLRYLKHLGQPWCSDSSNADVTLTRNWLRKELLPLIRNRFPNLDTATIRLSRQAVEIADLTDALAGQILADAVLDSSETQVRLSTLRLASEPRYLVRAAFVQLWVTRGWPRQEMGFDRWDDLAELAGAADGALTLPGRIEARRRGELLVLRKL